MIQQYYKIVFNKHNDKSYAIIYNNQIIKTNSSYGF